VCSTIPPFAKLGEPCDPGVVLLCQLDLSCGADRVCHRDGQSGDPCPRAVGAGVPGCRQWCVFATPDASQGTCGVPPFSAQTPCSLFSADPTFYCPAGTEPDTHGEAPPPNQLPSYCMCVPETSTRPSCSRRRQCTAGDCVNGYCEPLAANANSCKG
jgi:hypothetical protein